MNSEINSVENNSTDTSKALSDLIQNIQAKMNSEETNNIENQVETSNTDMTENNNNNNNNNNNSNNISSLLNNLDLPSILGAFSNNGNNNSNTQNSNPFSGIDPSFILKAQKIMSSVTRDDPKKNLLLSLKPFLRQSRQDKINEYISMLTIINALEVFSDKGSDKNV